MRQVRVIAFLTVLLAGILYAALPATDTFSGGSLGGNWTALASSFVTTSGTLRANVPNVSAIAAWTADTPSDDQYAQVELSAGNAAAPDYISIWVRMDTGDTDSGYKFTVKYGTAESYLSRGNTDLLDAGDGCNENVSAGSTIRIEASGTALTSKVNGSTVADCSTTDSGEVSGSAGLQIYDGGSVSIQLDNFEVGNISGAPATPVLRKPAIIFGRNLLHDFSRIILANGDMPLTRVERGLVTISRGRYVPEPYPLTFAR